MCKVSLMSMYEFDVQKFLKDIYKPSSCQFLCENNEYSIDEIALKTIRKIEKAKIFHVSNYLKNGHY